MNSCSRAIQDSTRTGFEEHRENADNDKGMKESTEREENGKNKKHSDVEKDRCYEVKDKGFKENDEEMKKMVEREENDKEVNESFDEKDRCNEVKDKALKENDEEIRELVEREDNDKEINESTNKKDRRNEINDEAVDENDEIMKNMIDREDDYQEKKKRTYGDDKDERTWENNRGLKESFDGERAGLNEATKKRTNGEENDRETDKENGGAEMNDKEDKKCTYTKHHTDGKKEDEREKNEEKEKEVDGEDNDKGTNEETNWDDVGLHIDRGWAWVVLAGAWLNITLMMGYLRGLSVLFVEYLRVFHASAAKTTLLMGVTAAVVSVFALFSMHVLVERYGSRKTVFLGATLSVTGLACAIAPVNIDFIIGTHSVLLGMGNAMIFGPSIVQVGMYFKKRRGLASAVAMSGVSMGGMIFPPMIRYLLDEYGLQGTMIILTGINMNIYVGASVFWPFESFRKSSKHNSKASQKRERSLERDGKESLEKFLDSQTTHITSNTSHLKSGPDVHSESPLMPHRRMRTGSTGSDLSRRSKNFVLYASQDFGSLLSIPTENIQSDNYHKRTSCNVFSTLDFSLFKRPMFIFVISYSFFCVTCYQSGAYLPALASEKGISKQDAALFLTVMGALDLVCRFLLGFLLDTRIIPVNMIMAIGLIVNGTGSFFASFYNSYSTVFMFACINGVSTCSYFGVVPVGIIEFMGIEYLAKTLGFVVLFHGLSEAIANPLIGSIRDATGSYVGAYFYLGVTTYIGAILLLCEPLARRFSERRRKTRLELDVES